MAQSEPKKIEPATKEEAEKLLTEVFGKEIFVETEYMKERNAGASKLDTINGSAWYLYYDGIYITFQSELPDFRMREIAKNMRNRFRYAINYEKNKDKLPPLDELINDRMSIRADAMRAFTAVGVTLVSRDFSPIKFDMDLALAHEKDWQNFEKYAVSRANELIIGNSEIISHRAYSRYFRFETRDRYWDEPAQWLYTLVGAPVGLFRHPQVKKTLEKRKEISVWDLCIDAPDIFNRRAKELGIDHLFKYESFHEGTHASRDEERINMSARSTEALTLKLVELTQPETLEKVKTFFREVIRETSVHCYLSAYPEEYQEELRKRVPDPRDEGKDRDFKKLMEERRQVGAQLMEERADFAAWREFVSSFEKDYQTIGEMIEVLRNPPPGKETVCDAVKNRFLKILPFMSAEFEQPSLPLVPAPSQASKEPQP